MHDAIEGVELPVIEVHMANVHKRGEFRHHSFISPVAKGIIVGFGVAGYTLGNGVPFRAHRPDRVHHLKVLAATHRITRSRVLDLIDRVGLTEVAGKRVGVAAALLGDPERRSSTNRSTAWIPTASCGSATLSRTLAAEGRDVRVQPPDE